MKKILFPLLCSVLTSQAVIWNFDLSPPGTDNAVGLSPLNEVPAVTNSHGSGNEIASGISFDTDTLTLRLSIGYGSAFGFTNLTGPATVMHIHGPAPTNVAAPVLINLASNHVYAANPTNGGSIDGTVTYSATQAVFLLAGSNYINIHTALNPGGEIRGQLIPVNTPPTIACPVPANLECTGPAGTTVEVTIQVADADGDALTVVWVVDGAPLQTNNVPAGGPPTSATLIATPVLTLGQHSISVSVSDGKAPPVTCATSVSIVDTTPPVITSASATPNVLWPPNHKLVPISLSVVATDLCSSVSCRIKSVTSNEQVKQKGSGHTSPDWAITGPLALRLCAERSGPGHGRIYTLTIECTDSSGNSSTRNVTVTVPHDQGHQTNPPSRAQLLTAPAAVSRPGQANGHSPKKD